MNRSLAIPLAFAVLVGSAAAGHAWDAPVWQRNIGSPGGGPGQFAFPSGIVTDGSGNAYVCDHDNNRIQILAPSGVYLGEIHPASPVIWPTFPLLHPNGDIYVTDNLAHVVYRLTPGGVVVASFGQGVLDLPAGIALDDQANILVASSNAGTITRFLPDGTSLGVWSNAVSYPVGLAVSPSGETFVAGEDRVYVLDAAGALLRDFGPNGTGPEVFGSAKSARIGPDGLVYVCDQLRSLIYVFTPAGDPLGYWGDSESGTDPHDPYDIAFPSTSQLWITDLSQGQIVEYGPAVVPVRPTSWGAIKARYR